MSALEQKIDELYALPLAEFTAARNALAKTLKGDDAARVKRLEKPSVVAWSVNQLYWVEQRTFDKLLAAGKELRAAQIAALKGRSNDLRAATSAHRSALADAVAATVRIAGTSAVHPAAEPLSRMLEALSLAQELPTPPGRFTEVVQPAGFEALAGITPAAKAAAPKGHAPKSTPPLGRQPAASHHKAPAADAAAERRRAEEEAAARKEAESAHAQASRTLDRARAAEARAQAHADTARQQLARADQALADAKHGVVQAERELAQAKAALKRQVGHDDTKSTKAR